jgi:GntR family transcriptional regulator
MLPFSIQLKPGLPVSEQILFAVKKAVVAGQMKPGDRFPSVRQISLELKINPNTAHKVVAALVDDGVLQVMPGIGTVVASPAPGSQKDRAQLLESDLEKLVVEAKALGLDLNEVLESLMAHWKRLKKEKKS